MRFARPNFVWVGIYRISVKRKSSTGEWVCRFEGCRDKGEHGYYTEDYDDAIGTAGEMAKGPPCCESLAK